MTGAFPYKPEVDDVQDGQWFIDIAREEVSPIFSTLASKIARQIFVHLHEKPGTASDLAASVDTSLQNAVYHLKSLQEAGLIQIADTWYSSRGKEMKVYAPVYESLVLVMGSEADVNYKTICEDGYHRLVSG